MARTHYHCYDDVPALGLEAGDLLSYDPADVEQPYLLHRAVRIDPAALRRALLDGRMATDAPIRSAGRPLAPVVSSAGARVIPIGPRLAR